MLSINSELQPEYDLSPNDNDDVIVQAETINRNRDDRTIEMALGILASRLKLQYDLIVTCHADIKNFLILKLAEKEHEIFSVMFLNNRHHLIEYEEMFRGTIDGAGVYPREIIKRALELNAAALIIAHNHPSGIANSSENDIKVTQRITDACKLVDIRMLDHIIIGNVDTYSFADKNLL